MGRTARDNRDMPHPKPVEKIQLSDQKTKLRLALVILLVLVAAGAFVYGVMSGLGKDSGWTTIEVNSSAGLNCGNEFVFQYYLGASGLSATAESKQISALYTDAMVKAYQLFTNDGESGNLHNVYYINRHPNEEIEVDALLYRAFETCEAYGNRNLYLAPVYEQYDSLFYCNEDWETESFDPLQNEELAVSFAELSAFARDAGQVEVQLLGDNRIRLYVSADFLKYAEENYISSFIDFYWMKNAFIADFIADVMLENGYTRGSISSYDGFIRNLDDSGTGYSFNLYDRVGQNVYPAAVMQYTGSVSIVYLRDYRMNSLDFQHYYEFADGRIRTAYLDVADGLSKAAVPNLVSYSESEGCANLLMQMIPAYITDSFNRENLPAYSVFCEDGVVYHNDPDLKLTDLYEDDRISYKSSCLF